ncbi:MULTISPECIES: Bug family tripartite tricarboxylate transporter substrate binding protein [Achromobacter]|uniref:Tripartite tricarboxylate transporter substrate binding protein n=1 Tax=Alcaligenes xylosoxydans xylosoxydans TaxID=85698 RepID=A0A424W620_ALCXX|nr:MULTISPECIES: tripartite tricarboxylate transporter substrate binding protein [Achromobacter]MBC9908430.1 tripartite tricarboxylate transporter substrate binding protein [Achromobacter xylosoxidans]MBD0872197.1 tripartite tricarboxylate transporter substrate binding protein [Achromobacter xylosoxidans]QNP83412.1 tripartite tricarboxylate transporter substrate binding protein [Achromobacter xylosoxidans]RPJ88658.1 tripartite tricarboxylate transporter substrate binding protein [Achromobacter 
MWKALLRSFGLACSFAAVLQSAHAEAVYPAKPIRLVVAFSPGGSADILARLLAERMAENLGKPVIVENKAGASGNIGGDFVARSAPDGYTLLLASAGPTVINPSLYSNMPYKPATDLAPVSLLVKDYNLMVINASIPARNLKEFIAYAKSHPGKLSFGSPGTGTPAHLAGELLNQRAGTEMLHVPYKGTGPAVTDLLAGHITMMIDNMPPLLPYVQSGKLRALAVASEARAESMPDVPTAKEAGLDNYVVTAWKGLMVPAGTPGPVIERLHVAVTQALASPEMKKRLVELGAEPVGGSPAQFAEQIRNDTAWWAALIKSTGTKLD